MLIVVHRSPFSSEFSRDRSQEGAPGKLYPTIKGFAKEGRGRVRKVPNVPIGHVVKRAGYCCGEQGVGICGLRGEQSNTEAQSSQRFTEFDGTHQSGRGTNKGHFTPLPERQTHIEPRVAQRTLGHQTEKMELPERHTQNADACCVKTFTTFIGRHLRHRFCISLSGKTDHFDLNLVVCQS